MPDPDGGAMMATTLPASPERVWPWLVQMGLGRGGWYSWDWLDNDGEPSADRVVAQWQSLEEGQHLYRVPRGPTNWWTVVVLEPNRTLVLQAFLHTAIRFRRKGVNVGRTARMTTHHG